MDANQLRELATNALVGHWPAHLGVQTDAEKIEFLARQLEMAADEIAEGEQLETENEALQNKVDEQAAEIETLTERLKELS
jgi:hypothetical protein